MPGPSLSRPAIAAGLAFGALELAAAWLAPAPGIGVSALDAAGSLVGLAALAAAIGALPGGPRWFALILALWACPRAAALAGLPWLGWAGALVAAGLALRWPRISLGFAASTALWSPLAAHRPAPMTPPDAPTEGARDLILITVDTLRADADFSPDPAGSNDWRRFDQAIAAAPWTLPSMYSLMTGLPVRRHGGGLPAGEGRYTRPAPGWTFLAERLTERGYATLAVACNPHLRAELGFDRGFGYFEHADAWTEPLLVHHTLQSARHRLTQRLPRLRHRRDELIVDRAIDVFRDTPGPRFLWVHLLGPHEYARDPWTPPPGWAPGVDDPDVLRAAYAINVAEAQRQVRRLIAALPDDAVIAVTSDHGEAMGDPDGEPGRWGHGTGFEDPQVHVPLWIRGPWIGVLGADGILGADPEAAQVAAWEASDLLHQVGTPLEGLHRAREVIELGGIRRDATDFALRIEGGGLSDRAAPAGAGQGSVTELPEEIRRQLEAIGYTE